jgi:hypothetical protein
MTTSENEFQGEHGSPEYKEHLAQIAWERDIDDVITALDVLNGAAHSIEDRACAARDLECFKEEAPEAYNAGVEVYEKAAAEASLLPLRARQRPPFHPAESRVGDVFSKAPPSPPFVVDNLLPRAHGVENAIGGAGKTTRHIWEAVHILLGRALYGRRVWQPGPVLFVTKEDDHELFRHRIHEVTKNIPDLTEANKARIAQHLHVLVLTGSNERLANVDRQGRLEPTDLAERIIRGYEKEGLALVEFDPFNMFGPGERFVNDGEAVALSAMAKISQALKCAVRATSHVSKAVGREGTSDAHSGRGGSAGGDNSRFVWNYWRFDAERDKGVVVPADLQGAADAGNLYRLHIAKLTAARQAWERAWIVREGFAFRWQSDVLVTPQQRRNAAAENDSQIVLDRLRTGLEKDELYTGVELEAEAANLNMGQKRIRAAVHRLRTRGLVVDKELPENLRKGGRKTYLEPVAAKVAPLDTSKPIAEQMA